METVDLLIAYVILSLDSQAQKIKDQAPVAVDKTSQKSLLVKEQKDAHVIQAKADALAANVKIATPPLEKGIQIL